ncbi:MAG: hypothetical protein DWQ05_17775 [Calditrichaeota bacterium]|nr:MAG: hypothetical protein DWQ05_17775 [Calditrichota bacterium]
MVTRSSSCTSFSLICIGLTITHCKFLQILLLKIYKLAINYKGYNIFSYLFISIIFIPVRKKINFSDSCFITCSKESPNCLNLSKSKSIYCKHHKTEINSERAEQNPVNLTRARSGYSLFLNPG